MTTLYKEKFHVACNFPYKYKIWKKILQVGIWNFTTVSQIYERIKKYEFCAVYKLSPNCIAIQLLIIWDSEQQSILLIGYQNNHRS